MLKTKIVIAIISAFLFLNAVMMISIPIAFDKDYIEEHLEIPKTEEGKIYEGLAAHNKSGLGAAMLAIAIILLMHFNQPERIAKRVIFSVGIGIIIIFMVISLGGVRQFVDSPPMTPLIIGSILGGLCIWVYLTPDNDLESDN